MVDTQESGRTNLDALAARIHELNAKWWVDIETGEPIKRDVGTMLMLMISEAAEAMEGRRKSKPGKPLMDDKLPHREMAEVELADIQIRTLDVLGSGQFRSSANVGASVSDTVARIHHEYTYPSTLKGMVADGDKLLLVCQLICAARANYLLDGDLFYSLCRVVVVVEVLAWLWDYDLYAAVNEKNEYNRTRHDHSIEGRKAEGGKTW